MPGVWAHVWCAGIGLLPSFSFYPTWGTLLIPLPLAAEKHAIPKVDNTNVDRSVATIHTTVLGCLRRTARVSVDGGRGP